MQTYDPRSVIITFRGILLTGYMDGTFVTVEYDEDAFMKHVGADGVVTRVANANLSASVVVTLSQGAIANEQLSLAANVDRALLDKHGAFLMKDLRGNTIVEADDAWIRKQARLEFAKEVTGREWTFDLAEMRMLVGSIDQAGAPLSI